jgi:hypothetical protein
LAPQNPGSRIAKVFCAAFFQKSGFFLHLTWAYIKLQEE